jgi:hypothetical protein
VCHAEGVAHDWLELTRRSSFASHRLIGWIYWDPRAIELYAQLGVPNGTGYYAASRGAPLLSAGHQAVSAAFYSIHPVMIEFAVNLAVQHASWSDIYDLQRVRKYGRRALARGGLIARIGSGVFCCASSSASRRRPVGVGVVGGQLHSRMAGRHPLCDIDL